MNPLRENWEAWEREWLSPYAARSAETRGRMRPIPRCEIRTEYQRDRDRILHCKAFRRLKHKTQCFIAPENDHFRTRLTHTLEVAQVSRTIARALRLNEDLTEAIAYGHDLGHAPFGHIGERVLDELVPGGFRHNVHSLRVVDCLERDGEGLNLTAEVRDGILQHRSDGHPGTVEGEIVALADRIAYINHDIQDALSAGVLRREQLPEDAIRCLGQTHGERTNTMVSDVIRESDAHIRMSATVREATLALLDFLTRELYFSPRAREEERRASGLIRQLFAYYMERPHLAGLENAADLPRAVCDLIAGMTDPYAVRAWQAACMPSIPL